MSDSVLFLRDYYNPETAKTNIAEGERNRHKTLTGRAWREFLT
jgi:hypothetical protein